MNYNSVAEIYDANAASHASFLRGVEGLTDEQASRRPAPDRWSVAEIVEHVGAVERLTLGLFEKMLARAEESGLARGEGAAFAPVSIAEHVERSRTEKYQAPEAARPGGARLSESLATLADTRAAIERLRPRFERYDCTTLRFPHPAFGPLDLYQWLAFVGAHQRRHLAQIEAVRSEQAAAPAG